MSLSFSADVSQSSALPIQSNNREYVVLKPTGLMAFVDTTSCGSFSKSTHGGIVAVSSSLASGAEAKCFVYIPG